MRKKILILWLLMITVLLVFASCDFSADYIDSQINNYDITVDSNAVAARRVFENILTKSVMITVERETDYAGKSSYRFYSGILISSDGYIVTCGIDDYMNEIYTVIVTSADNTETVYEAQVVDYSYQPERLMSLTILKINEPPNNFDYVNLDNTRSVNLGDELYMLAGDPNYQNTAPTLSASRHVFSETIKASSSAIGWNQDPYGVDELIKTNGTVNGGNLGGFLFDNSSSPVGMIVDRIEGASSSPSDLKFGIGLSISIDDIKSYINAYYEMK